MGTKEFDFDTLGKTIEDRIGVNEHVTLERFEETIKFYSDAFGWTRPQTIKIIKVLVYPFLDNPFLLNVKNITIIEDQNVCQMCQ